jgi:uncharacterized protein (UPF0332 family)
MSVYILPEIERRRARGEKLETTDVWSAQVVFEVDKPTVVRLNEEVRGRLLVRSADPDRAWTVGEDVTLADIAGVSRVELPSDDENAAHITLLVHAAGASISFDATYNRPRIATLLGAAEEFIASASADLKGDRLRPFAESAFHAAEHLAKAELLPLPDERFLKAKTHSAVANRLHWWSRLGNIDPDAAKLLSQLESTRHQETYLAEGTRLTRSAAEDLYRRLLEMHDRVVGDASKSGEADRRRRRVTMVAARELTAAQLVQMSDNQLP